MELSLSEIWIIVGIFFTVVLGTLVSIVLVKIIQVLDVATEIVGYYKSIKKVISAYNAIPGAILEKIKSIF